MKWIALALTAPLLLAGCGSSPPTHFYTLDTVQPAGGHSAELHGPPVQVRDIELPGTLDRLQLVLRGPGAQVQVLGSDRWSAPLKGMIRQTLTQDLRDRLGENAVISPGAPAPSGKVQVLIVTFEQFAADTSGRVTLEADWSLGRGNPPKPVASQHEVVHANSGSSQPGAVAEGMSRALGQLADRVAARL